MAVEGLSYTQYLYSISNPQTRQYFIQLENAVAQGQISPNTFAQTIESVSGKAVTIHRAANGDVIGYTLNNVSSVTSTNPINSNVSTVSRGKISMPVSTGVDGATGKAVASRLSGVGTKVITGAAKVGTAAMCVGTGIALGKTIDGALYNLNPDFWDSNGMASLNPETWSAITAGNDSTGASLLNVLFGFDENGNGQAYIDENALAYFAAYMNQKGVFNEGTEIDEFPEGITFENLSAPIYCGTGNYSCVTDPTISVSYKYFKLSTSDNVVLVNLLTHTAGSSRYGRRLFSASKTPYNYNTALTNNPNPIINLPSAAAQGVFNDKTVYYTSNSASGDLGNRTFEEVDSNPIGNIGSISGNEAIKLAYVLLYGEIKGGIDGIGTQPNATTPQLSGYDVPTTLNELKQQYPDLWNDAITYPVIQNDGTVKNYTYVPVPLPENFTRTGTQPTSGNATQTNTEINPITATQPFIDTVTKTVTNPYPETKEDIDSDLPPENPTDTGDGSSPVPIVPVGSASSLWKIYHPTQSQVDSFGGWLWSSNFIDQILKIFNNPMEAIIGLHKIYATPIDAGNTTIKVGYLDSNVPSAYIEQQYITVDCGSVSLSEAFANVFDYSPFTDVNLYLPFIGIVKLDVNDVMRSTINIKYGVDVITGACLAMVNVSRDSNNSTLYQYSGNCAVQYPISSGSYMGIVSSIISIAGGVAATVATGGGAAPLVLGAAGAAMNAHTNVQHSGSFSGNAGAMGGKIPYLIISRPQTKMNSDYSEMEGTPTNHYTTIGECEGYVKAKAVHVINVNATDGELDEIQSLLMSGIII